MKRKVTFILLLFTIITYGQRLKEKKGDIKSLKGISNFSVIFDYSHIEIPHYVSEEAFLETKMLQREKEQIGAGEQFKNEWFANRKAHFEPSFIASFNNWFNPKKNAIDVHSDKAKHIIKIEIVFLYTGYNVVAANQNAKVGAKISIFEKNKPSKIIFQGKFNKVIGASTYDEKNRIAGAFANLAKHTALYILRKAN